MCVCVCVWDLINKDNFFVKSKFIFLFKIVFHKCKLLIVCNWFIKQLFQSHKIIFEAIQTVHQIWTEFCHQIFAG